MMKNILSGVVLLLLGTAAFSDTLPFDLNIQGKNIDVKKSLELSDVGEGKTKINFNFRDKSDQSYNFDLKYKSLPSNRSFPANLDITIKNARGDKLGYLFFANNGVKFLKQMGVFGLVVDINGEPVDFKFTFDADKKGQLMVSDLTKERFVQDTLVPKFNFQMIRPVIMSEISAGHLSQTYSLDSHPYAVNYTARNMANGVVEFQHNLYQMSNGKEHLLERIYFHADSRETLREAMYAGKYFHKEDGAFKLVFYPALGQIEPNK